jgi:hypothetical protein
MAYVPNNAILFYAAIAGFSAGALDDSPPHDSTAADYANLKGAALALAQALDTAIPLDAGIVTPITQYGECRAQLVYGLAKSASGGTFQNDSTVADYTAMAAALAAVYTEISAAFA